MKRKPMLLLITATVTGLMAGLFFAWSVSVTTGIGRLPNREYLAAFQAMNRAILNPLFFICFFGAAILLPVSAYVHYGQPVSIRFWLLLAAAVIYLVAVMGVTIVGNIPLNTALDQFNLSAASPEEMTALRDRIESRWNLLNHIRTVASTFALILAVLACMRSASS